MTFKDWDPAEWIETKEDAIAFIEGAFEEDDSEFLERTLGYVVRSKGFKELVKDLGPGMMNIPGSTKTRRLSPWY